MQIKSNGASRFEERRFVFGIVVIAYIDDTAVGCAWVKMLSEFYYVKRCKCKLYNDEHLLITI